MPATSLWPRFNVKARAFLIWLLCCTALPTTAALIYEVLHGETALTRAAPWLGALADVASVLLVIRPTGSPRAWVAQVRQWLERNSTPLPPVQPGAEEAPPTTRSP